MPSFWELNEGITATVISMWKAGYSANGILKALGHPRGLSRSAVMAKIHRLGLKRTPIVQIKTPPKPKPQPTFKFKSHNPESEGELTDLPEENGDCTVSLFDVRPDQCRWPVGPLLFCGAPVVKGCNFSFCAHHHARGVVRSYRSINSGYNYKRW